VRATIARKRYRAKVLVPPQPRDRRPATVRIKLGRKAYRKLRGRSSSVTLNLTIASPAGTVQRPLTTTVRCPGGS
jgi:hypothetical protein